MHIVRINYQINARKNDRLPYPAIHTPAGYRWHVDNNEDLEYDRTEGDILPYRLLGILSENAFDSDTTMKKTYKWPGLADNPDIIYDVEGDNVKYTSEIVCCK